jgi:hypothetical protein
MLIIIKRVLPEIDWLCCQKDIMLAKLVLELVVGGFHPNFLLTRKLRGSPNP